MMVYDGKDGQDVAEFFQIPALLDRFVPAV